MRLKFLGTGGGRFVTGSQKRKTGGILIETEETQLHLDPGPGALIQAQNNEPEKTEAVLVSHAHLDHCNDVSAIIEMMAYIHEKPSLLYANESCLSGFSDLEKVVSNYHQNLCSEVKKLEEGFKDEFKDIEIKSQEMFHGDPKTQGLKICHEDEIIGFWTDTEYSDELTEFYKDCDILVIYCNRPKEGNLRNHTSLGDVPDILKDTDISTAIITDFGHKFLDKDMDKQLEWIQNEVDQKIVFAEDGMEFPGNRRLDKF